jgi:hypothetical protein
LPNSRATIAAWDSIPPRSVTTAPAIASSGIHAGDVIWHKYFARNQLAELIDGLDHTTWTFGDARDAPKPAISDLSMVAPGTLAGAVDTVAVRFDRRSNSAASPLTIASIESSDCKKMSSLAFRIPRTAHRSPSRSRASRTTRVACS